MIYIFIINIRGMSNIKTIDIIGDCTHDSTCSHFCMITYKNETYQTIKMTGIDIVSQFWSFLSVKNKQHFQYIYDLIFLQKVRISKNCINNNNNNKYACEFTYKNGTKNRYIIDKENIRFYKDYIN